MESLSRHRSIAYVLVAVTVILFQHGSTVDFGGYISVSIWICSYVLAAIFWWVYVKRDTITLIRLHDHQFVLSRCFSPSQLLVSTLALQSISPLTLFELHTLGGNLLQKNFAMILSSCHKPVHNSLNPKTSPFFRAFPLKSLFFSFLQLRRILPLYNLRRSPLT